MQGAYGSFSICPVCDWEDDGLQLANPTSAGGANSLSLNQAQHHALQKYPAGLEAALGYLRSPNWRPLSAGELQIANDSRAVKHWHEGAVTEESQAYWYCVNRAAS